MVCRMNASIPVLVETGIKRQFQKQSTVLERGSPSCLSAQSQACSVSYKSAWTGTLKPLYQSFLISDHSISQVKFDIFWLNISVKGSFLFKDNFMFVL